MVNVELRVSSRSRDTYLLLKAPPSRTFYTQ